MLLLAKIVHVLVMGLWFGTCIFFTFVVGLTLFATFDEVAQRTSRPLWLPLPPEYEKPRPSERFPEPLRREQGSRVAGAAVGVLFPWYYGIQALCGVLALVTALAWYGLSAQGGSAQTARILVLVLALVTVSVGWWLERVVHDLGQAREQTSETVLRSPQPTAEQVQAADAARAEFGRWHVYSLMVNFVTIFFVTLGMALAAVLPAPTS